MLSSESSHPTNSQTFDKSKKLLGPRPYPVARNYEKASESKNETPSVRAATDSHYSRPHVGPKAQLGYLHYPSVQKADRSPYVRRSQDYIPIYYGYDQPPKNLTMNSLTTVTKQTSINSSNTSTVTSASTLSPAHIATARPTYPPPRTTPSAVYSPQRLHISQPASPLTFSSDSSSASSSTPEPDSQNHCRSKFLAEGRERYNAGIKSEDSSYESLSCSSSEDISSNIESLPKQGNLSTYIQHENLDSSLVNHSNLETNVEVPYDHQNLAKTVHPIENRQHNCSDSFVNNSAMAKRNSINSIDSHSSDDCDSLPESTTSSERLPLRPTSIIELRPRELRPSKSNRNSTASLLNLPGPGDVLKRATNPRASLTLVNEESALGMYRETAKKTNDPKIQLEFAKFLLFSSTTFGDPSAKDGNASLKKLLDEAIFWIKRLQKAGQPEAMYIYALWLEKGVYGFPQNADKALALYKSSSKQGFVKSTYKVGHFYEQKKEYSKAVQFYMKAASGGSVSANYRLGSAYLHGEIKLKQNLNQAMLYLARSAKEANKDCPDGAYLYGIILAGDYKLIDVSSLHFDLDMAQEYIKKAADLGYCPALHRLGACYEFGELGFPANPSKSITFYREGAEKGDAECQMGLSGWYASGAEGVLEQNDYLAHSWCFQATSKGLPKAEFAMGYYYEIGVGVTADPQIANDWYLKAAAHGSQDAQRRLANGSSNGPLKGEINTLRRKEKRDKSDCIIS